MSTEITITVILRSGAAESFKGIEYGKAYTAKQNGIALTVGEAFPAPVTVTPNDPADPIASIEYDLFTDMRNYHEVIVPDSGRAYSHRTALVDFWFFRQEATVHDFKMPLYIFLGQDMNTAMAFGVVGRPYETEFRTLEPRTNRALIAFMRRLSVRIRRGTESYPIPDSVARARADGSITEHLYFRGGRQTPRQPWLMTLREFAEFQKKLYDIPDVSNRRSMAPLWCSWTDWFSDDVTDEVILNNVREGLELGIKNFIIDDGWFGPGLDNDFDVELNIGDWQPDPAKIKDMPALVREIKELGGAPMIWCAPHAVAPGAKCFEARKAYLIRGADGELVLTGNKFHSLCFMCPDARKIMADICESFITQWDFDGAKYDLFNCVPNEPCRNPDHEHDVTSMMEGLELTLKEIAERCFARKKDYIVELKQNYATPFLSRYGTMTRAGDTPYNNEGNFARTIYVQAYTPFSINDYQTITQEDSPEEAACVVIKMIAAGIPTYSIDFDRLPYENKAVLRRYNTWYNQHVDDFMKYRVPLDGNNNVIRLETDSVDYYFLVNQGGRLEIDKSALILNGTFQKDLFVIPSRPTRADVTMHDCFGNQAAKYEIDMNGWSHLDMLPGGTVSIERKT
ncbi:MAG: alpha-galactosidase [Phycisphaerae bacterium]|nr:alpha-galactosidase [Phycisphaerae bacterium]